MGITLPDTLIATIATTTDPAISANTNTSAENTDSASFILSPQTSSDEQNADGEPTYIPQASQPEVSDSSEVIPDASDDDAEAFARKNWMNQPTGWGLADIDENMPSVSADLTQSDTLIPTDTVNEDATIAISPMELMQTTADDQTNTVEIETTELPTSSLAPEQYQTQPDQPRANIAEPTVQSDEFTTQQSVVEQPLASSALASTTTPSEENTDEYLNDSDSVSTFTLSNNDTTVISSIKRSTVTHPTTTDDKNETEISSALFDNTFGIPTVPSAVQTPVSTNSAPDNQTLLMTEFVTANPSFSEKGTKTLSENSSLTQASVSTSNTDREFLALNTADTTSFQFSASGFTTQQTSVSSALGQTMLSMLKDQVQLQLTQNTRQATIRLDPPSLGHLQITITQSNDGVSVQISASHDGLRQALEQSREQLKLMLSSQNTGQIEVEINQEHRESPNQSETFSSEEDPVITAASVNQTNQAMPSSLSSAPDHHWLNAVV